MAIFSKAGYTKVAEVLSHRPATYIANSVMDAVAENLADIFEQDNERFDRQRFLKAAGVIPMEETTDGPKTS